MSALSGYEMVTKQVVKSRAEGGGGVEVCVRPSRMIYTTCIKEDGVDSLILCFENTRNLLPSFGHINRRRVSVMKPKILCYFH